MAGAIPVLSAILAAVLLVAGIQTLRLSPSGRTLHLWWAWPKLAVAIFAAVANYYTWNSLFAWGMGGGDPMALALAGGGLALSIAWPIAVLVILSRRSMREFYRPEPAMERAG